MTIAEAREYARKNYAKGGDAMYECWDDKDIQEFLNDIPKDQHKTRLDREFQFSLSMWNEMQAEIF